ncbi:MAG: sensor histidine kinase, partial [Burkholderiales bacterium]
PSGSVRIDWKAPTLTVIDTGPGIPEMHRERMFDRHFRGSDAGDGFGLGLAIVKRACDHCGWSIAVSTPSDDGTAFELTLS